jgi:hypothetical protein
MKAPDSPEDVILETGNETRCALATLVALEALRHDDETDWWEGTAADTLGHFDNLLACARTLANQHGALVDYLRQETHTFEAGWLAERAKERAEQRAGAS